MQEPERCCWLALPECCDCASRRVHKIVKMKHQAGHGEIAPPCAQNQPNREPHDCAEEMGNCQPEARAKALKYNDLCLTMKLEEAFNSRCRNPMTWCSQ